MALASTDWDPGFMSPEVAQVRRIGGFYRALTATTIEQHRSAAGPTFRLACGESLHGRILLGVPAGRTANLPVRLVGFVDHRQVEVHVNGQWARSHALELLREQEHVLEFSLRPMAAGLHRLLFMVFEDDGEFGLFGAYDLIADVYVGDAAYSLPAASPQSLHARTDPSIRGSGYGIRLTTEPDVMRLAADIPWSNSLVLHISLWGSAGEGARPVALIALQDYEQLDLGLRSPFVLVQPDTVTVIPLQPRPPTRSTESLRVVMLTNPAQEMAPLGTYVTEHRFKAYASQKAWLRAPAR